MQTQKWRAGLWGIVCAAALGAGCGSHDGDAGRSGQALDPKWGEDEPILPPTELPVPSKSVLKSQEAGTLPGELGVSSSGQPNYTLPLLLPEGRAGMQPSLALHYDGSNRNGPMGVGWSLRGLSRITPCRKTVAQDGAPERVRFAAGDEYCLDGTRLVAIEGSPGDSGTEYRLEEDQNIKVVSLGTAAGFGVPESFVAHHPNGQTWTYSRRIVAKQLTHESPIGEAPSTRDVIFAWALERIADRSGNVIRFEYEVVSHAAAGGTLEYDDQYALEYYPKQIVYTLSSKGLPGHRRVYFYYENRPDVADRYVSGVHVRTGRRLVSIEAQAPYPTKVSPAWRYHLFYTQSSLSGRSLVESIKMCDALGGCLPPTEFTWQVGSDAYSPRATGIGAGTDLHQLPKLSTGDFNRDGKADVLYWDGRRKKCLLESDGPRWVDDAGVGDFCNELETYDVSGQWKIAYSDGSGFGAVTGTGLRAGFITRLGPYAAESTMSGTQEYNPPLPIDFDGDGATDLLSARAGEIRSPFLGGALLQTIGSTFSGTPPNWEGDVRYFGDFDGDGRIDLFTHTNRPLPNISVTPWGDEVTGWHGPHEWHEYAWVFRRGTGSPSFGSDLSSPLTPYMQRHDPDLAGHAVDSRRLSVTMDVDGDGRMELVVPQPAGVYQSVELDGGAPTSPAAVNLTYLWPTLAGVEENLIFSPTYLDINGDGLRDVIAVNGVKVTATGRVELPARINTGQGYGPWYLATLAGYTPPAEQRDSLQIDRETSGGSWPANPMPDDGVRIFDFNSDGLDDFMVPTAGDPLVYVSDGRHFTPRTAKFSLTDPVLETVYDEPADTVHGWFFGWTHKLADVSGDGQADLVQYDQASRELEVWVRAGEMPDKLINVRNGLVRNETVTHRPLTDPKIYTPGSGCSFPVRCIHAGGQVVSSYTRSAPGGLTYTFYSYEDARVDVHGRGHLGFRRRHSENIDSGRRVTVEYGSDHREHGAYPLAGVPLSTRSEEAVDSGKTRVDTSDTQHTIGWSHADRVYRVRPLSTHERSYETGATPPATLDPSGARRTRITTRTWDGFGNLLTSDVRLSGRVVPEGGGLPVPRTGTRTFTSNTYDNRVSDWLIGLPTRREVTSYAAPPSTSSTTRTTDYVPDAQGRIVSIIDEPGDPRLRRETTVHFGGYGQVDAVDTQNSASDPEAPHQVRTQSFSYDDEYLYPKTWTNALGHTTQLAVHPAIGRTVALVDPNGVRVDHRYDGFGRHRWSGYPGGYETATSYEKGWAGPYLVRTASNAGDEATREYNSVGLAFKLTARGFKGKPVTLERVFDVRGNLIQQSNVFEDPAERVWTGFGYDGLDRVLRIDYPDGSFARNAFQVDERRSWDRNGNESYIHFDVSDRPVLSADVYTDTGTPKPIKTRYEYAPFDLVETITDHEGNLRRLAHDPRGRQTSVDDPDAGLRTMIYNGFGELIAQQDPVARAGGASTRYQRDLLGRVTERASTDGVDRYFWDAPPSWASGGAWIGARHATESADGVRTQTRFDSLGRPQLERTWVDGSVYDVGYAYDAVSRVSQIHYPEVPGATRFKTSFSYGMNGALARIDDLTTGRALWTANARDAIGRVEDETFGNGVSTTHGFDVATGRLDKLHGRTASGANVYGFDYKYDANGNMTYRNDFVVGRVDSFEHDSLDRLKRWTRKKSGSPGYATNYGYDALGNLASRELSGGSLSVVEELKHLGAGVRPNALVGYRRSSSGSVVADFAPKYDDNGRRVEGPWEHVSYTSFDLPREVHDGSRSRKFAYDADQNRVQEVGKGTSVVSIGKLYQHRITASGKKHVFRVLADEGVVAERTFDEDTGAVELGYVHRDHLGSGVALTNASGAVSERRHFTPFGDVTDAAGLPTHASGGAALSSGFTGHDHDGALGLIDMNGRVYDPLGSSFLTPDPIVALPLFGQALNRYSYVWNTPLKYTDPTGLVPEYDPNIELWVDEAPQGTAYPELGQADMEFYPREGICTACDDDTADSGSQSSDADSPPGSESDAPPGGDDTIDTPEDAMDRGVPVHTVQYYEVRARERAWNTMNRGESWYPGDLPVRVVARISVHVTFYTDEDGHRQAYFDPNADVEISIESSRIAPTITVSGTARNVGGAPEVAFTISIQDSSSVSYGESNTQNSPSATGRLGATSDPVGLTVTPPTSSQTTSRSRQTTITRGHRARGIIRERSGTSLHPELPQRAYLPQHGPTPAGLPNLSAKISLVPSGEEQRWQH